MILVFDASVTCKWFLHAQPEEAGSPLALEVLLQVASGGVRMLKPPHFIAEVAGMLARIDPANACAQIADLQQIAFEEASDTALCDTACELAITLGSRLRHALPRAGTAYARRDTTHRRPPLLPQSRPPRPDRFARRKWDGGSA